MSFCSAKSYTLSFFALRFWGDWRLTSIRCLRHHRKHLAVELWVLQDRFEVFCNLRHTFLELLGTLLLNQFTL
jgi:hypothetical protein